MKLFEFVDYLIMCLGYSYPAKSNVKTRHRHKVWSMFHAKIFLVDERLLQGWVWIRKLSRNSFSFHARLITQQSRENRSTRMTTDNLLIRRDKKHEHDNINTLVIDFIAIRIVRTHVRALSNAFQQTKHHANRCVHQWKAFLFILWQTSTSIMFVLKRMIIFHLSSIDCNWRCAFIAWLLASVLIVHEYRWHSYWYRMRSSRFSTCLSHSIAQHARWSIVKTNNETSLDYCRVHISIE
jgi:hypothetical protein